MHITKDIPDQDIDMPTEAEDQSDQLTDAEKIQKEKNRYDDLDDWIKDKTGSSKGA